MINVELDNMRLLFGSSKKKKKGKKALRTDVISNMGTQTASAGSGLQIPTGGQ